MCNLALRGVVVLCVLGVVTAYAGQYVPKSYFVIDRTGHESDRVYLNNWRYRRSILPMSRFRRSSGGGSGSSSYSSASASSSSSSSSGSNQPIYFGEPEPNHAYSNVDSTANQGGSGGHPGAARSFASASSSSSSGNGDYGTQGSYPGNGYSNYGNEGPQLFSRFGEDTGSNINVGGSIQGKKGAFVSSSSSIDSDGKIKYSVQSGKY